MEDEQLIERSEIVNGLVSEINKHDDRRIARCKRYSLGEIFFLVLCAQISNYETFREYEMYGRLKLELLRKFLSYKYGAPSRSTIGRVLAMFDPKQIEEMLAKWVQIITSKGSTSITEENPKVVAIDGKRLCGSQEQLHLVAAFDTQSGLVLGEQAVSEKSNEITAIPQVLDMLAIQGHIVSIDAMGCQQKIAKKICDKGADYFLALKQNQGGLYEQVELFFGSQKLLKTCDIVTRHNKEHGRIESRTCYVTQDIAWVDKKEKWEKLKSLVMIESKRTIKGRETTEKRFFITSSSESAAVLLAASRAHWGIENSLHWVLDVIFREDERILWNRNLAQNEAIIRRLALSLIKKYRLIFPRRSERSEKIAIKTLRKVVNISDEHMINLLTTAF
jgi:predicted transposase YbfD/YdcC